MHWTATEKQIILETCKNIRKQVIQRHKSTSGMCFNAALTIQHELNKGYIKSQLIEGLFRVSTGFKSGYKTGHYWNSYKGIIFDVTLDQFNNPFVTYPEIVIGNQLKDSYIPYQFQKAA